jgi:hypothetical protein
VRGMFDSEERRRRAELLINTLAKLYVVVGLSAEAGPLCRRTPAHDPDCPAALAWSLLDEERQREARRAIKAFAFRVGYEDACSDSSVH